MAERHPQQHQRTRPSHPAQEPEDSPQEEQPPQTAGQQATPQPPAQQSPHPGEDTGTQGEGQPPAQGQPQAQDVPVEGQVAPAPGPEPPHAGPETTTDESPPEAQVPPPAPAAPSAHAMPEPAQAAPPTAPDMDEAFYTLAQALHARLGDDRPAQDRAAEIQAWYQNDAPGSQNHQRAWQHVVHLLEQVLGHAVARP